MNDATPARTGLTPDQRTAIADLLGNTKPATDSLLVSFGKSIADRQAHDHTTQHEDWYCLNLSAYMGERMAPVLRRLLDAEARIAELEAAAADARAVHAKHADSEHCQADGEPMPCSTLTALGTDAAQDPLPPYGIKPHWVTFRFSAQANRLYDLYNAHVNRDRGDRVVWPTLDDLASMMGLSRGDKVTPYMRELEAGGAIEVQTVTKTGGEGRRYVITVKVSPPAGYEGPADLGGRDVLIVEGGAA